MRGFVFGKIAGIGIGSKARRAGAVLLLALTLTIVPPAVMPARAQGIPTIDFSNLGQNIVQAAQQILTNGFTQIIQTTLGGLASSVGQKVFGGGPFAAAFNQIATAGVGAISIGGSNLINDLFKQPTAADCPYCAAGFTPSTVATIDGGTQFTPLTSLNMPAEMVANGNSYGAFTQQQTLASPPSCFTGVSGCTYLQGTLSSGSSVVVPAGSVAGSNIAAGTKFTTAGGTQLNFGNAITSKITAGGTSLGTLQLDPNNPFGNAQVLNDPAATDFFAKLTRADTATKTPSGVQVTFKDGSPAITIGALNLGLKGQGGGVDFSLNQQALCAGQSDCTATDTVVNLVNCAKNGGNINDCLNNVAGGLVPAALKMINPGAIAGGQSQPTGAAASPAATYSSEIIKIDNELFAKQTVPDNQTIAYFTAKRYELLSKTSTDALAVSKTLDQQLVALTNQCNDIAKQTPADGSTLLYLTAQGNALTACQTNLMAVKLRLDLIQVQLMSTELIAKSPISSPTNAVAGG